MVEDKVTARSRRRAHHTQEQRPFIQGENPKLVIRKIREVVGAARKRSRRARGKTRSGSRLKHAHDVRRLAYKAEVRRSSALCLYSTKCVEGAFFELGVENVKKGYGFMSSYRGIRSKMRPLFRFVGLSAFVLGL